MSVLAAVALAAFYLATSLYIASERVFWFDELFTIHIARLPDFRTIWTALAHGVDSQPPFYYLIVRWFGDAFGDGEVAARLPSAIGFTTGLLLIFDCARRLTDARYGLIALSVATCSFLPYYGYEARPYGLFFMLAALAFWLWTCASDGIRPAILFGAVMAAGVLVHYYFVLCLVPYAIRVLAFERRLASRKLIAGFAGAGVAAAVLAPLILSFSRNFATGFWNRPSLAALRQVYSQMFPDGLLLIVVIVIWIVLAGSSSDKEEVQGMQPAEITGWLFLCIPVAGFAVAELKTNAFYGRYFIGLIPGVAVAFACWIWRHSRGSSIVPMGIIVILAGWGMETQLAVVHNPSSIEATGIRDLLAIQGNLSLDGKRYLVFSSPLLFIEAQYYSDHPDDCILLLPSNYQPTVDPRSVASGSGQRDANLGSFALELGLAPYYPLQFWKIGDVENHASEAALIEPTHDTLTDVRDAGLKLETRFSSPLVVSYLGH